MQNQLSTVQMPREATTTLSPVAKPLQLVAALLLGAVIMYAAGFVQLAPAHNAAHDMRHAQGFPCH